MSAPLRLHLVRHGETAWSLSGQHTGRSDIALTPAGEQMARDLAPSLTAIASPTVLTSPRLRARRTCELAGLGGGAEVEPDLAEWDYGDYEGLRSAEIRQLQPGWDIWRDGVPNGELPDAVAARADRLIARLGAFSGDVVLFSHGHFGRVLAARWIGLPLAAGRCFLLDPASVGVLAVDAAHDGQRVVSSWNLRPIPPA